MGKCIIAYSLCSSYKISWLVKGLGLSHIIYIVVGNMINRIEVTYIKLLHYSTQYLDHKPHGDEVHELFLKWCVSQQYYSKRSFTWKDNLRSLFECVSWNQLVVNNGCNYFLSSLNETLPRTRLLPEINI